MAGAILVHRFGLALCAVSLLACGTPAKVCGPNTTEMSGECVGNVICGEGTTAVDGTCVRKAECESTATPPMPAGCEGEKFAGAQADIVVPKAKLDLPAVPELDVPPSGGAQRTPRELRLTGRSLFGSPVEVKGVVTWVYDCRQAEARPGVSAKELDKVLADEPERCLRPHFHLGQARDTTPESSIWVVELPRPFRKDEVAGYEPAQVEEQKVLADKARVQVGDEVIVRGQWDQRSPRGFANSDGLVIYESLDNLTTPYKP